MKSISFYKEVDETVIEPYKLTDGSNLLLVLLCEYDSGYLISVEGDNDCVVDCFLNSKSKARSCLEKIMKKDYINIKYLTEKLGFEIKYESQIL